MTWDNQRLGSEVLLYTEGNAPMDFSLSYPPCNALGTDTKNYIKRAALSVQLGRGTLMIWKDCDDQFFCHEAAFNSPGPADASAHRICFVFRWLTSAHDFRTNSDRAWKCQVSGSDGTVKL